MRGIALEGGGAKGSYQVGVLKALNKLNIKYNAIVGTSIGSINGALMASGQLDELEKIWLSADASEIFGDNGILLKQIMKHELTEDFSTYGNFVFNTIKSGGIDASAIHEKIKTSVDEDQLRKSDIRYGLVTLSLKDWKPIEIFLEDIPEGKVSDYIMASSNFPGFKSDNKEQQYLDGGMYDNLPINMLIEEGYDEIIAIRIFGIGRYRKVKYKENTKVLYIEPREDLGKIFEIDKERAAYNINLGYYDTMKIFHKLQGDKYYIKSELKESDMVRFFSGLDKKALKDITDILKINQRENFRFIFETVIPAISNLLGYDGCATYEDIFIGIIEKVALKYKINRFKVYKVEYLIDLLVNKIEEENQVKIFTDEQMSEKENMLYHINKWIETVKIKSEEEKNQIISLVGEKILLEWKKNN